jgi:hypothetical protein
MEVGQTTSRRLFTVQNIMTNLGMLQNNFFFIQAKIPGTKNQGV